MFKIPKNLLVLRVGGPPFHQFGEDRNSDPPGPSFKCTVGTVPSRRRVGCDTEDDMVQRLRHGPAHITPFVTEDDLVLSLHPVRRRRGRHAPTSMPRPSLRGYGTPEKTRR